MLTVKIYLEPSGRVKDFIKDFPIYQGQYNNILLNVFVPTSILAPNFTVLSTANNSVDSPFVSGTAVEIASRTIERNGKYKLSKTYYMRYVKTLVKEGTEYALFERKLPKEFVFYAGAGINAPEMILNVVNVNFGEMLSATAVSSNAMLQVSVNLPNTVIPVTQDYVFEYGIQNKWYLNGYEVNIKEEYGITYTGTAVQGDTITLSVVASKPTTIQTVTSQTVYYDVMPSTDIDQEPSLETGEIETIEAYLNSLKAVLDEKQDKIDVSLATDEKSVVGAINGLKDNVDTNNERINENTTDIESLKREIGNVKNIVATGENYIGTYVYQASSESDMPSDQNLLDYAKSIKGQGYELQNGDVIIVIQSIQGKPDRRYKYIYNGTTWANYEILPIETAQNGVGGIVWGTWGVGDTNHTLVDIQDGKIAHIYIYYGNAYRDLHTLITTNTTDIANIKSGATTVGQALRATSDALGNNIVNTYLTKAVGATQQYVKDYALPRQFNDTLYLNTDGVNNSFETQIPTTPFRVKKQLVLGDNHIFTANLGGIQYDYQLSAKNGYELYLVCSCNKAYNGTLRVAISYDNELISADLFPIAFTGGIQKVELSGIFNTIDDIADTIKIVDSNLVTIEVDFITDTSEVIEFECVSMVGAPSYFRLFVDYQAILSAKVVQTTGNSVADAMSQKAVTELLNGKLDLIEPASEQIDFVTIVKDNNGFFYQKNLVATYTPATGTTFGVLRGFQGQILGQTPPLDKQTDLDLINRGELTEKLSDGLSGKVPITPDGFSETYAGLFGKTGAGKIEIVNKTSYWDNVENYTNYNCNGSVAGYSHRATGENVLYTGTPDMPSQAANKKYVDTGLDGKVDKVTTAYKVYGTDGNGNQKVYNTGWSANASMVQLMDQTPNGGYNDDGSFNSNINGTYMVAIPNKPSHATPKKWVEDNFTVYKHLIQLNMGGIPHIFNVLSTRLIPYTNASELPKNEIFTIVDDAVDDGFEQVQFVKIYNDKYVGGIEYDDELSKWKRIHGKLASGFFLIISDTVVKA